MFAPPGSSIDQLSHVHADNKALTTNEEPLSTWKIEDVAIESILTMIFQLPLPLHVEVYYYSVLISCCRELPESIAPVFGRAIRFLYNNLETLDYELKIRFLDWMTIQISNFDFSWKWDEWVKDSTMLQNLKFHPKKNFIKNLIAKEIRLSNKNKIKDSFVTIDSTTGDIVKLDTFYQYLTLSLVDNEESYVVDYDSSLYGGSEKVREIFQTLANQRREKKEQQQQEHPNALIVSPQEELIYNFSLPTVPLNEIANSVYDFVVANWKSNSDFQDLCKSVYLAIEKKQSTEEKKEHDEDNIEDEKKEEKEKEDEPMVEKVDENGILDGINKDKYLVNLIIQTYVYIGSRSIYSAVSVFSRDIVKLRYLAGWEEEKSEEPKEGEFQFEPLNLTTEQFNERQQWIIESIFRVWNHQPQVAFLILEYLIEFKILKPISLLENVFETGKNLIIENVSCMESINRVLTKVEDTDDAVLSKIFELIVINLNSVLEKLETANDSGIIIEKKREEFTESEIEDKDLMRNIDNQWLYYEYLGLLKSYIRKFKISNIKEILERINSTIVRDEALAWVEELKKLE